MITSRITVRTTSAVIELAVGLRMTAKRVVTLISLVLLTLA